MQTGQTLLVIAAFALLSTVTLAINSTLISTVSLGMEMEASLNALSIGQSMLDEIMLKDFDENTTNGHRVFYYSSMTPKANFGPEGSEAIAGLDTMGLSKVKFDDVDDYHGYRRGVWNPRLGWFTVTDTVIYLNEINPNHISASQTWHKRIIVTVTNPLMPKFLDGSVIPYQLQDISIYRRYY